MKVKTTAEMKMMMTTNGTTDAEVLLRADFELCSTVILVTNLTMLLHVVGSQVQLWQTVI